MMTKILVLYYSMYGHIEIMAKAIAEGVRSANADVVIKRVPDTMSPDVAMDTCRVAGRQTYGAPGTSATFASGKNPVPTLRRLIGSCVISKAKLQSRTRPGLMTIRSAAETAPLNQH